MPQPLDEFTDWLLHRFMENLAGRVSATEAAAFLVVPERMAGGPLQLLAHVRPGDADEERRGAAVRAFKEIAAECVDQGRSGAIDVGGPGPGSDRQYCLVAPFPPDAGMRLIFTLIAVAPDQPAATAKLRSLYSMT